MNYIVKGLKKYKAIVNQYNHTDVEMYYQRAFRQSDVIGKCMNTFWEWLKTLKDDSEYTFDNFANYYLTNIKSIECFETAASILRHLCLSGNEKISIDTYTSIDYIIAHAIAETFIGGNREKLIHDYVSKNGAEILKNDIYEMWDRTYGIDLVILYNGKKFIAQIKPISFFLGERDSLIKDRQDAVTKINEFKKIYPEFSNSNLKYIVYDDREDGTYFLSQVKNSIFNNLDETKYFQKSSNNFKKDFCGIENDYWIKLD